MKSREKYIRGTSNERSSHRIKGMKIREKRNEEHVQREEGKWLNKAVRGMEIRKRREEPIKCERLYWIPKYLEWKVRFWSH